jgi:hypothetical protein
MVASCRFLEHADGTRSILLKITSDCSLDRLGSSTVRKVLMATCQFYRL